QSLREHPERSRLHQMVAALTDLCLYLMGVSPLTVEDSPGILRNLPSDDWDEEDTQDGSSLFSGGTSEGSGSGSRGGASSVAGAGAGTEA
ncbi:unnamed protein product, partial [Discosporangium mesarthrocarpum]